MKKWFNSAARFLHEVWVEVRFKNGRVSWPTFESVKISTKVVIISSLLLGLYIGVLDMCFDGLLSMIIKSNGMG